jgi:hypothetical protein
MATNANALIRWGFQEKLGIPARSADLVHQAGFDSESVAMTPGQIPNAELRRGSQAAPPLAGSVTAGGDFVLSFRAADVQTLFAQAQGFADLAPLTPPDGPTGSYKLTLSPEAGTDQRKPITFEIYRDDGGGSYLLYDAWVSNMVIGVTEQSRLTLTVTITGGRTTYWGDAVPLGLTDVSGLTVTGFRSALKASGARPGTAGGLTVEIIDQESPGVWNVRALLGRQEILASVDTVDTSPVITLTTPGSVDLREVVFVGDWIAVTESGIRYEVGDVNADQIALTAPFAGTLSNKRLFRVFGAPVSSASVTFQMEDGLTPEGRPKFAEVIDSGDGLIFGANPLRTEITTAGEEIPALDHLELTGTVSVTVSTIAWTGVGTLFLSELVVGSTIWDGTRPYTVASIISDLSLTVIEPHTTGLSGATVYARRQFLAVRDRPAWAYVASVEPPLTEIFARFIFEDEEVEVADASITITPPRPAQTRVGSPWSGTVLESGFRAVTIGATTVYTPETQLLHDKLELSVPVGLVVVAKSGVPVISPVSVGESDVAAVETSFTLIASSVHNLDQQRHVVPGPERATFPINASAHATGGDPDLKIELVTSSDALPVAP